MSIPDLQVLPPSKPRITIEFLSVDNVKCTCENFPREMKLTCVNILASGAAVLIVEPVASPIVRPNMQS